MEVATPYHCTPGTCRYPHRPYPTLYLYTVRCAALDHEANKDEAGGRREDRQARCYDGDDEETTSNTLSSLGRPTPDPDPPPPQNHPES